MESYRRSKSKLFNRDKILFWKIPKVFILLLKRFNHLHKNWDKLIDIFHFLLLY